MRIGWLVTLLLLPTFPTVLAAQPCSQPDLHPLISKVKAVQSQLLAYKLESEIDESVPPALQAQIRQLKDAFAELGDAAVQCAPAAIDAKSLEGKLARLLDANKPVVDEVYDPKKPPQLDHIYGDDVDVKVTRPSNRSGLLLLDYRFGIECGFDSLLLGYEFDEGHWKRVLRWQSKDYDDIGGAFGDFFDYLVLPGAGTNGWELVAAHGYPWCSSNLSAFFIDLLQPQSGHDAQKALYHRKLYYRRDTDPIMQAVPNGIQLRMSAESIDAAVIIKTGIFRFVVNGNELERVQPIANDGRDFVDEWLQSPWSDAARWSSQSSLKGLQPTHDWYESLMDPKAKDFPMLNYGAVRACSDSKAHFQVELDESWVDDKGNSRDDVTRYFQIEEGKNSFTMLSAPTKPDPRCNGHNIMPAP